MNVQYIKEITGVLVKWITPILHRLQEAFILFEDQTDNGSDRAYYLFEGEFPEVDVTRISRQKALETVIPRFAGLNVYIDYDMVKSYYKLPLKEIQAALNSLADAGTLVRADVGDRKGFMLAEDYAQLSERDLPVPEDRVYILHRSDFLVKSHEHELKRYPKWDYGVVYYLLVTGVIKGAVYGRFTFGPVYLDDVWLDMPPDEGERIRGQVFDAIYEICDMEKSPLQKYRGAKTGL